MADLAPYPDVEDLLVQALTEFATTGTVYPPDLQQKLPFVRVRRIGGEDDRRTDVARVDVEVAARTRAEAWQIARAIQQRLITGPIHVPGKGLIDRTITETGPREVLHEDPHLRPVLTTYRPSLRR